MPYFNLKRKYFLCMANTAAIRLGIDPSRYKSLMAELGSLFCDLTTNIRYRAKENVIEINQSFKHEMYKLTRDLLEGELSENSDVELSSLVVTVLVNPAGDLIVAIELPCPTSVKYNTLTGLQSSLLVSNSLN